MNGVILESLQNTELKPTNQYSLLGSQVIDNANNGEVMRHYNVAVETSVNERVPEPSV